MPVKNPMAAVSMTDIARNLSEKLKMQAIRPNLFGYVPHPKQEMFHSHSAKHRLYIGGNRAGKTVSGIVEDIWWLSGTHPYRVTPEGGVRGRIVGVDFTSGIEKILKPEFIRWCPASYLRGGSWAAAYDKQERTVHFENGSFCEFMSYDQDIDKFAGTSRHFVHFDEEPPEDIYLECLARLVDTGGSWWMTLTPIQGMEWMYDSIYIKGINDFGSKEKPSNIGVIEVDMHENPYLGAQEVQEFIDALGVDDIDARVKGKFIRRGGLIYKDFSPPIHTIERLDSVREFAWEIYMSLDHGFNNPTAVYWHGVDRDGDVVTFHEHYQAELTVKEHAAIIHDINKSYGITPNTNICDPALSQRNAITGDSIQTEYAMHGVYLVPGNNDVLTGINKVNTYLKPWGPGGRSKWKITRNCEMLIYELQRYRWKTWANKKSERTNNKYDVAHKKDDHGCDAVRYFFTFMPDLTPVAGAKPVVAQNVLAAPAGVPPSGLKYDTNLRKPKTNGDWHTENLDEYMGGEWVHGKGLWDGNEGGRVKEWRRRPITPRTLRGTI